MKDSEMQKAVISFFRDWAIPGAVALVTATGAVMRWSGDVERLKDDVLQLHQDHDRAHTGGSNGILDPTGHGILDQHVRHFLEEELGKPGYRKFVNQYSSGRGGGE